MYFDIAIQLFTITGRNCRLIKVMVFMILLNYQLHSECMTVVFICIYQLC